LTSGLVDEALAGERPEGKLLTEEEPASPRAAIAFYNRRFRPIVDLVDRDCDEDVAADAGELSLEISELRLFI
jgi:hypothetical protein